MAGWYFLTMATEREFGIAAWFLGVITGVKRENICARWLAGSRLYRRGFAWLLPILVGEFLVTSAIVNKVCRGTVKGAGEAT